MFWGIQWDIEVNFIANTMNRIILLVFVAVVSVHLGKDSELVCLRVVVGHSCVSVYCTGLVIFQGMHFSV